MTARSPPRLAAQLPSVRRHGDVPENLADDAACIPAEVRPLQEFCVASSRNYSEDFVSQAVEGLKQLAQSPKCGVSAKTIARVLLQIPKEKLLGKQTEAERAMLISYLTFDAFNDLDSLVAFGMLSRITLLGDKDWQVRIASPTPRVTSMNGLTLDAHEDLSQLAQADAVLVGSGIRTREIAADAALMSRLHLDPARQLIGARHNFRPFTQPRNTP